MDSDGAMERLEGLQRDLIAFSENRLPNLERLSAELEASIEDLRKLLDKRPRSDESRKTINPQSVPKPETLKIEDVDYRVTEDFRQAALQVADELDLDELDAAKLCINVQTDVDSAPDLQLPYRALLQYHKHRFTVLDCVRLLLMQSVEADVDLDHSEWMVETMRAVIRGEGGRPDGASAYWKKCMDGLSNTETSLQKISDHRQSALMTGVPFQGDFADALLAQRLLVIRQHETIGAILSYLTRGGHIVPGDFRSLLSKAAALEEGTDLETLVHYFPALVAGATYFGASDSITASAAKELHSLFAVGPGQLKWKMQSLRSATTAWWLAEYSARFLDPTNTGTLRVADRQREEDERTQLFLEAVENKALHLILVACEFLKPEVWHDPAKTGLVRFLLEDHRATGSADGVSEAASSFADLTMTELQAFCDALVANMPDVLRRMKADEDDRRRNYFSHPNEASQQADLHLERFMVIMAYAYQDDAEATQDFWADKDSNMYGFLKWASQRLPTPRVAAFCELLTSIANNEKAGNQAHRLLMEDSTTAPGKLRKSYSVNWSQIFSELEVYANSIRNKPALSQQPTSNDGKPTDAGLIEPETHIMLESYLQLAAHICRVSAEARNWILREQTFHIAETLIHLASSGQQSRIHTSCFNFLTALLTEKVTEVNDGMWVLLDSWISGGGAVGTPQRHQVVSGRLSTPGQQYLRSFAANAETASAFVNLLNTMILPASERSGSPQDCLPFPENLGSPHRHAGVEVYVDFVLGVALKSTIASSGMAEGQTELDVLQCACLDFICIGLSTFNEDLVALTESSAVSIDGAIRASSLRSYARLHPFARIMDWMFNHNTIAGLVRATALDVEELNNLDPGSPKVQATLRSVTAMNLAMKLQATYFDVVRPLLGPQAMTQSSVANAAFSSFDEVLFSHLDMVSKVMGFTGSDFADLSLEALSLLRRICASRKLEARPQLREAERGLLGQRLIGAISDKSSAVATNLQEYFQVYDWDLENGEQPLKLIKASAVVDLLNDSLDSSSARPSIAHCLLGFDCLDRKVTITQNSPFAHGQSLFHSIAAFAATAPYAIGDSNISWLLSVKRGCLDIILKSALAPMTAQIVQAELRAMDLLGAACQNQLSAFANPFWDYKSLQDGEILLGDSSAGIRDFLRIRQIFFEYSALDLRSANEAQAFSVREKILSALLGVVRLPSGEVTASGSIFDMFDFSDLQTIGPPEVSCRFLADLDLDACHRGEIDSSPILDVHLVEQLLVLRKRELSSNNDIKDASEEQQLDDEIRAIIASILSQNNWQSIRSARLAALEAWTDLISLMVTSSALDAGDTATLALQGLQVVLPSFDRTLSEDMDAAALLAKLTLALVSAEPGEQTGKGVQPISERLLATFRVCLKAITDSDTDLALRDVCYRTCGVIFDSLPMTIVNGKIQPSANAKQLHLLTQSAGDRLVTVITEDAFSGRGVTRVSSLLFLDALIALSHLLKSAPLMLRALTKLNFVPVLIDQSIGTVATSFGGSDDELTTSLAYFHTSLSLLLRMCQTADGTQLVLNSGFFAAIADSRLFSTDPDIGLDIDNPLALQQFYKLLSSVLRVITAMMLASGTSNAVTIQQGRSFLMENRFCMQAVFKRNSALKKTAGPPEKEATDVAEQFSKLLLVTDFLDEDESAQVRTMRMNGFT